MESLSLRSLQRSKDKSEVKVYSKSYKVVRWLLAASTVSSKPLVLPWRHLAEPAALSLVFLPWYHAPIFPNHSTEWHCRGPDPNDHAELLQPVLDFWEANFKRYFPTQCPYNVSLLMLCLCALGGACITWFLWRMVSDLGSQSAYSGEGSMLLTWKTPTSAVSGIWSPSRRVLH